MQDNQFATTKIQFSFKFLPYCYNTFVTMCVMIFKLLEIFSLKDYFQATAILGCPQIIA